MKTRRSLYEIGSEWLAVEQVLDDCGGDISDPRFEAEITKIVESIADEEGEKLDGMVRFFRQLDMESAAAKSEADEWLRRATAKDQLSQRIRGLIRDHLIRTVRPRLKVPSGMTLCVQTNGGTNPIEIDRIEPEMVPDHLCKVTRSIDREAVRAALEAGELLTFARILPRGSHLRIR